MDDGSRRGSPVRRALVAVPVALALAVALWAILDRDDDVTPAPDRPPAAPAAAEPVAKDTPRAETAVPGVADTDAVPGAVEPRRRGPPPPRPRPPPARPPYSPEPEVRPFERRVAARLRAAAPATDPIREPVRLRVADVAWDDAQGRPFFRADSVRGRIDVDAALRGDVVVDELVLVDPTLLLEEDAGPPARWNYERVFADVLDRDAGPGARPTPERRVLVRDVEIRRGRVAVRPAEAEAPYVARDLSATLPFAAFGAAGPEGPRIRVATLDAVITAPEYPDTVPVRLETAQLRLPDGAIGFDVTRLELADAVVTEAVGLWTVDATGPGLDLRARVANLPLRTLDPFAPEPLPVGTASFAVRVEPAADARSAVRLTGLALRAPGSDVSGDVSLLVGGPGPPTAVRLDLRLEPLDLALLEPFTGRLPYTGELRGRIAGPGEALRFDLGARLRAPEATSPIVAQIAGRAALDADGFRILALTADLRNLPVGAFGRYTPPILPPDATLTGRVAFEGAPGRVPTRLDVDLNIAGGRVTVAGTLDTTGPVPAYDLSGRFLGIRVDALFRPALPPVALTAEFDVAGRGADPETIDAGLRLSGDFTGWRAGPGDGVTVRADIAGGVLALETATLELASLAFDAAGRWRYLTPAGPGLEYRLTLGSLAAFAAYVPYLGDRSVAGAVRTEGELAGTLERPRLDGAARAEDLAVDGWSAASLTADYALVVPPREGLELDVAALEIETPTAGDYARAVLEATVRPPTFAVALRAERARDRPAEGGVVFVADGRFDDDGERVATVRELRFFPDSRPWALAQPATIRWGGADGGVRVRRLRIREVGGPGVLAIDGRFPPARGIGLEIEIASLPVGPLSRLAGLDPALSGRVWADGMLLGTLAEPRFELAFRVLRPTVDDVALAAVEGDVAYAAERLSLDLAVRAGPDTTVAGGMLDADIALPFLLSFAEGVDVGLPETGAISGRIVSDRFPLRSLGPLLLDVRDPEGWVNARIRLAGTLESPVFDGEATLVDGAATFVEIDQRYDPITADVGFEGRTVVVRELRATSDGMAIASGTARFATVDEAVVDLQFEFDEFRPIGVEDYDDAAVWGRLQAVGPVDAPVVTGDVRIDDGSLPLPAGGGGLEAVVDDEAFEALEDPVTGPEATPSLIERIRLDEVSIRAGGDLWFVSEQVRVQLAGDLTVTRTAPDALEVEGTLRGDRGTITIIAGPVVRRLEIVEAEVRFVGDADLDPAIDITAAQTIYGPDGEPFDILVRIGGTADEPTLALASPNGAPIPESELASLLIFGQPSYALEPGVVPAEALVEDVFFGGLAGLAAIELEQALIGEFGLPFDYVRIRPGPGQFGGLLGAPAVVLGTEIADDLVFTVDTGISTLFGGTDAGAIWGASLRWRVDPEWTLSMGIEPIYRGRLFPVTGFISPGISPTQQFFVDIQRRWTY